jgi:thioredoxin 1
MQARTAIVVSVLAVAVVVAGAWVWPAFERAAPTGALVTRTAADLGTQWHDYRAAEFEGDLAAHRTVLVAVHADWCTDCAAQAPILARLMREPQFNDTVGYIVNFDRERKFLAAHKVRQQSTLIVFRDGVEVARSVADTNEGRVRALFERGL